MASKLDCYNLGGGGVNLVKDPLQLADDELTQAQNAELLPDEARGGLGALSQRGGLTALTSALAGSVLGMVSLPLKTTYTRTLYASLQEADSDTWLKTTDGTTWTATSTPLQADDADNPVGKVTYSAGLRIAAYSNKLIYPGGAHVTDLATSANNTAPPITMWDGTTTASLLTLQAGPSSDGNLPYGIVDMLVANNTIYIAIWETPNSGELKGRVLALDVNTGRLSQIAAAFGESPNTTGGFPACMAYYRGQLFVGLNNAAGTNKVVRCYPGIDTTWTTDVANLAASGWVPVSMMEFRGDLYMGVRGISGTSTARVLKRTTSTGAWASVEAGSEQGICYFTALIVYSDELYAVLYEDGVGDNLLIRKTADGTTWTTDRDVEASDAWNKDLFPINSVLFGSDLFVSFKSSTKLLSDGFILRKSGGTWSKVVTDNFGGFLGVLVERT